MPSFDQALNIVHDSLVQMRDQRGDELKASAASLARLAKARPPAQTSPAQNEVAPATTVIPSTTIPVTGDKVTRFAKLQSRVLVCEKCPHLVSSRTQVVFGVGNINAELMFVGEAPGEDEDLQGEPFVGKAGQLLTKIIAAMGFDRSDVYIGNVLKCRPDMPPGASGNRKPKPDEMKTCLPWLIEQIDIIKPRLLVALGATAMEGLTGSTEPMNRLRGRWHEFQGIPLMATYHPAYLLRLPGNTPSRGQDHCLVFTGSHRQINQALTAFHKAVPEIRCPCNSMDEVCRLGLYIQ